MNRYLTAFAMTQSMFCALHVPRFQWREEVRPCMLLFLPAVGLEIGLSWKLLDWVLRVADIPFLMYGLFMCAFPYLITGLIHLDGFMDVADAVGSCRDLEKRRAILKDAHVGSFAVVWCVFLLLAGFALFASMPGDAGTWCLVWVPVVSRCCSALAVLHLKAMSTSQYARGEKTPGWHTPVLALLLLICLVSCFLLCGKYGLVLVGELAGYGAALWCGYRSLQGMNGDISGFCLTASELCAVAVCVLL